MTRQRRLVFWLLVLAFTVQLPLGGALAAAACAHESAVADAEAGVDHFHHHAHADESAPMASQDCCHGAPDDATSQASCNGDGCSGCTVACQVLSSLPNAPLTLGHARGLQVLDASLASPHHIYPQVPHQPPRV